MVSRGTRGRRTGASRSRRKLVWARQFNTGASIAAGPGEHFNADLIEPFRTQVEANIPGMTIVRLRGAIMGVEASGQARSFVMGVRTYTRSFSDYTDSLLDQEGPVTDPHADWMAFETVFVSSTAFWPVYFDVKSMRKLEEVSQSLMLSVQTPDELGGQVRWSISALIALP